LVNSWNLHDHHNRCINESIEEEAAVQPTTVYIGPYIHGAELSDGSPNRPQPSVWQTLKQVWRHFKLRLNPNLQRRNSVQLFVLEILIGLFVGSTILAAIFGMGASTIIALSSAAVLPALALLGIALRSAWCDYQRQLAAVHPRRMLSPLAFRLADSDCLDAILAKTDDLEFKSSSMRLEAIRPEDLRADDVLLVEPGQFIHADGFVLKGTAIVDEAAVTGESNAVIREANGFREVMRDSLVVMGQLLVQVAPQPLEWWSESIGWRLSQVRSGRTLQLALHGCKLHD
jgi:high-affinity K+ transport system ATPase subunit B